MVIDTPRSTLHSASQAAAPEAPVRGVKALYASIKEVVAPPVIKGVMAVQTVPVAGAFTIAGAFGCERVLELLPLTGTPAGAVTVIAIASALGAVALTAGILVKSAAGNSIAMFRKVREMSPSAVPALSVAMVASVAAPVLGVLAFVDGGVPLIVAAAADNALMVVASVVAGRAYNRARAAQKVAATTD